MVKILLYFVFFWNKSNILLRNGFILVRKLWDQEEVGMKACDKNWKEFKVDKLRQCMEESTDIRKHAYGRSDGQGAQSKVSE